MTLHIPPHEALRYRAIFDLDGTLSDHTTRLPLAEQAEQAGTAEQAHKAWALFHQACENDRPIMPMVRLAQSLCEAGWEIIIITGRHKTHLTATNRWLKRNGIPYHALFMRAEDDVRPTMEFKLMLARQYKFVTMVFDDHDRHSQVWRDNGYHCCQSAKGTY